MEGGEGGGGSSFSLKVNSVILLVLPRYGH